MEIKDKCNGCPINSKADYLKNMVCKRNCPREDYRDPLDVKLIDLQERSLQIQHKEFKEVLAKATELEKYADEINKRSIESLDKTMLIASLFNNKFGVNIDMSNILQRLKEIRGNHLCNTCHFTNDCPFDYNPTQLQFRRCEGFATTFKTWPDTAKPKDEFDLNGTEFKIEPFKHFTTLNNSQSKLQ